MRRRRSGCTAGWSGRARGSKKAASGGRSHAGRCGERASRGRVEIAFHRSRPPTISTAVGAVRPCLGRLVVEILHRRRGQGRHLPAPVANQRVGHGGRPCGAARRRRARRRSRRHAARLWQDRLPQPRLLSPPAGGKRRRSGRCSPTSPAAENCRQGSRASGCSAKLPRHVARLVQSGSISRRTSPMPLRRKASSFGAQRRDA